jgi:hypothetical protein
VTDLTEEYIQREIAYERACLVALGLDLVGNETLAEARAEYKRVAAMDCVPPLAPSWHSRVKSRLANWAEWERDLPRPPANNHYAHCEACRAQGLAESTPPQVHLHGQHGNHDDAYIVGDRKGLLRLAEAIQTALAGLHDQTRGQGVAGVTARDGEGYALYVVALSEERFAGTQLPYQLHGASPPAPGRPPWSLVTHAPDERVLDDKEWFRHPAVDDHRPVQQQKKEDR